MNSLAAEPTVVKASVNWAVAQTARQRYDAGFDAYCHGATLEEVAHDPQMTRGWWAALNAEAACESTVA